LIYSGQEACLDKRLEFFKKDPIEWKDCEMAELYTQLNELKETNKALWNGKYGGEFIRVSTDKDNQVFAFTREKEGDRIFVVSNLGDTPVEFNFTGDKHYGDYTAFFSDKEMSFDADTKMKLDAWEYKVFVK
jgi:hypothetical protein